MLIIAEHFRSPLDYPECANEIGDNGWVTEGLDVEGSDKLLDGDDVFIFQVGILSLIIKLLAELRYSPHSTLSRAGFRMGLQYPP